MSNWTSLSEFLHMGGYSGFVWSATGISVAVLVLETVLLRRRRKAAERLARMRMR